LSSVLGWTRIVDLLGREFEMACFSTAFRCGYFWVQDEADFARAEGRFELFEEIPDEGEHVCGSSFSLPILSVDKSMSNRSHTWQSR